MYLYGIFQRVSRRPRASHTVKNSTCTSSTIEGVRVTCSGLTYDSGPIHLTWPTVRRRDLSPGLMCSWGLRPDFQLWYTHTFSEVELLLVCNEVTSVNVNSTCSIRDRRTFPPRCYGDPVASHWKEECPKDVNLTSLSAVPLRMNNFCNLVFRCLSNPLMRTITREWTLEHMVTPVWFEHSTSTGQTNMTRQSHG